MIWLCFDMAQSSYVIFVFLKMWKPGKCQTAQMGPLSAPRQYLANTCTATQDHSILQQHGHNKKPTWTFYQLPTVHRFKLSWKTSKWKSKNHLEIESKSENTTQKTTRLSSYDSFSPHLPMSMRINSLNSVSMFTRTGPAQIDGPYREMTRIWWLPSLSLEENIKRKRATVKLSLQNSKENHTICACNMIQNTKKTSQKSSVCFRQSLLQLPKVFASAHHWAAPTVWIRCTVHHNWWCVHHDFSPRSQPGHRATLHHTQQWRSRRFLGYSVRCKLGKLEFSGKMTQAIPPFNAPSRLMIRDSWLSFGCKLHCVLWSPASLSNISGGGQLYPRCHTSIDSGRSASSMSRIDNKELVYLSHQKAWWKPEKCHPATRLIRWSWRECCNWWNANIDVIMKLKSSLVTVVILLPVHDDIDLVLQQCIDRRFPPLPLSLW